MIKRELTNMFRRESLDTWIKHFADVDCCLSPVLSLEESIADRHMQSRNIAREVDGLLEWACPIQSVEDGTQPRPAPELGEHTEEVLAEIGRSR